MGVARLPDFGCQVEAVHLRHLHVEDGEVEGIAIANPGQRLARLARRSEGHAPRLRLQGQDAAVGGVVVDDQQLLAQQLRGAGCLEGAGRFGSRLGPDGDVKGRSLARHPVALDPHGAAHHLAEPAADGQSQAGAAVAARGRGVDLAERAEQPIHAIGRDADPGITDLEVQRVNGVLVGRRGVLVDRHRHHYLALFSELDGVAEQVGEDLAQAGHVSDDRLRRSRSDQVGQIQPLFARLRRQQVEGALDALAQVERLVLEIEPVGLDLGEIQDVVDDRQQRLGAVANGLGEFALFGVQGGVQQQAGHADDGVHGGANLVAHGRQEGALCLVGGHRRGLRLLGRLEQPGVVEGQRSELREAAQQLEFGAAEGALGRGARSHADGSHHLLARGERDGHHRLEQALVELGRAVLPALVVADLLRLAAQPHLPRQTFARLQSRPHGVGEEADPDPLLELLCLRVEQEDIAVRRPQKLSCPADQGV